MPGSIWKGAISFGLVNIPVALHPAESRQELRFHQVERSTGQRIRQRRVNEQTGDEVAYEDIAKGYDVGDGRLVTVTDEELAAVNPKATHTIDILGFVDAGDIDVTYFDKPYYIAPAPAGRKAYALLRAVLRRSSRVGIALVVIRTRQYLAAVFARGPVLVLELMRFAYELRDPAEVEVPDEDLKALGVSEAEMRVAEQLVDAMTTKWEPENYRDVYRDEVLRLIEEKAATGRAPVHAPVSEEPAGGEVIDIMALLKRSIEEQHAGRGERAATGTDGKAETAPAPTRGEGGKRRKSA